MKKTLILAPILIILFIVIDIVSKVLVFKFVGEGNVIEVIKNLFYIEPVYNTGASFGMLKGMQWFFIVLTILVLPLIIWFFIKLKTNNAFYITTFSFIVAGAVGNLIDRIFFYKVRDFIFIKFFPAIFNFADICITVGVICLAICFIMELVNKKKSDTNGKV